MATDVNASQLPVEVGWHETSLIVVRASQVAIEVVSPYEETEEITFASEPNVVGLTWVEVTFPPL